MNYIHRGCSHTTGVNPRGLAIPQLATRVPEPDARGTANPQELARGIVVFRDGSPSSSLSRLQNPLASLTPSYRTHQVHQNLLQSRRCSHRKTGLETHQKTQSLPLYMLRLDPRVARRLSILVCRSQIRHRSLIPCLQAYDSSSVPYEVQHSCHTVQLSPFCSSSALVKIKLYLAHQDAS